MKELPPIERLNELFSYDSHTGIVTRKCARGKCKQGDIVGAKRSNGYLQVNIGKHGYLLHRIIWKLHTGEDPYPYEIDHINRVKDDNRIDNIRLVDSFGNKTNRSLFNNNTSGYPGVNRVSTRTMGYRYQACITRNKKYHFLGVFDTPEEAHNAIITSDVYNG